MPLWSPCVQVAKSRLAMPLQQPKQEVKHETR